MLIKILCDELGISEDEARLILADTRADFADCETITNEEARLIRDSQRASLPGGNGEVPQTNGIELSQQKQIIRNASQVFGVPLFLSIEQEINTIASIEDVKNHLILNTLDQKQSELDEAIRQRASVRQEQYYNAVKDLAGKLQQPISVVEEMQSDIDEQNAQLADLLTQVREGKY